MGTRKTSIKSSKSPQQERSRQLVGSIMSAGFRVLESFGFEQLSTTKVAEVAGVSVGSLYQYFPDKGAIVASLIEKRLDDHIAALEEALAADPQMDAREFVDYAVNFGMGLYKNKTSFMRELFRHATKLNRAQAIYRSRERARRILYAHMSQNKNFKHIQNLEVVSFILIQTFLGVINTMVLDESCTIAPDAIRYEVHRLFESYLLE